MRNKILAVILIGVLGLSSLTACGGKTPSADVQPKVSEPVSEPTSDNADATPEAEPQDASEPEDDSSGMKKITISDWGYDDFKYVKDEYMFVRNEGEKWKIIDTKTGEQYTRDGRNFEYDSVSTELCAGNALFRGININDDGTYTTEIIQNGLVRWWDVNQAKGFIEYIGDMKFSGYSYYYPEDGTVGIYKYKNDDGELCYSIRYSNNKPGKRILKPITDDMVIYPSFGWIIVGGKDFISNWGEKGAFGYAIFNGCIVDEKFKFQLSADEYKENDFFRLLNDDHYTFRIHKNASNAEGWVAASRYDLDAFDGSNMDTMNATREDGFYNLNTREFILFPEDVSSFGAYMGFTESNNCPYCSVTADRAALWYGEGDSAALRLFELKTGKWANDNLYRYVGEFGFHKYVRVANQDGKWGYIKDDDLTEAGEWFDYATDFCNGYALVQNGGKMHLIDEDFNVVSEDFDCEKAGATRDYVPWHDRDERPLFTVMLSDGKYHLLIAE